jgi:hypothetical protein
MPCWNRLFIRFMRAKLTSLVDNVLTIFSIYNTCEQLFKILTGFDKAGKNVTVLYPCVSLAESNVAVLATGFFMAESTVAKFATAFSGRKAGRQNLPRAIPGGKECGGVGRGFFMAESTVAKFATAFSGRKAGRQNWPRAFSFGKEYGGVGHGFFHGKKYGGKICHGIFRAESRTAKLATDNPLRKAVWRCWPPGFSWRKSGWQNLPRHFRGGNQDGKIGHGQSLAEISVAVLAMGFSWRKVRWQNLPRHFQGGKWYGGICHWVFGRTPWFKISFISPFADKTIVRYRCRVLGTPTG